MPESTEQPTASTAPLNLNSDVVVKEISKETPSADLKPEVFSTDHNVFTQSIFNSEHSKKVTGMVEAGAGVGTIPAQYGFKSEKVNCENAAIAINDQISRIAQVSVYAQAETCRAK